MTARFFWCICLMLVIPSFARAQEKITLREELRPGETAVVSLEFREQGEMLIPESDQKPNALRFSARGKVAFEEKLLELDPASPRVSSKSLRYYTNSFVESVVEDKKEDKKNVHELRESIRIMINEVRNGKPYLFSPLGPLTVEEFELVEDEAQLDSLVIGGLLPVGPAAVGDKWKPLDAVIATVFNLFAISKNEIEAKLESADESQAKITLNGKLAGTASGTQTERTITGQLVFDRMHSKITHMELVQSEDRKPGPIGPGLRVQSGLTFDRKPDAPIVRLGSKVLEELPLTANDATVQLVYLQPDGRYRFHYPRGWHIFQADPRVVVLRLLENGEFVAQCNVVAAPNVAAGNHMSAEEFRAQVRQALGNQFQRFLQEGEVPAPKGYWIYRLSAAGSAGNLPVVWYYHLAAGAQGQQLVFIFRVAADQIEQFGANDLSLVSTIEFGPSRTASSQKEP